ncbi:7130_t:CDS:2 [Funneliformis geosporum]|uniref:7130_t:CDS:1 n=1 Tax=Funneliformis geosporum TaxID=1117311 RepID=A0A9W4SEG8_9GLOM|nr:7130_t:CDS:2 [Funneliformis geosporum]
MFPITRLHFGGIQPIEFKKNNLYKRNEDYLNRTILIAPNNINSVHEITGVKKVQEEKVSKLESLIQYEYTEYKPFSVVPSASSSWPDISCSRTTYTFIFPSQSVNYAVPRKDLNKLLAPVIIQGAGLVDGFNTLKNQLCLSTQN